MSEQDVRSLIDDTQRWLADVSRSGWSDASFGAAVEPAESGSELFGQADPPLVVGLFGGTGVGKSSLLNRLAGQAVARTGVVRPTSMAITAYLHEQVELTSLPTGFPIENFAQSRHRRDDLSNVVWVDMPDFDSDEIQNREQVLQWLPHINLLVYVVTRERYRDAEGWKLLLQQGYRHAWLFVINQWDRADPVQLEDFTALLKRSGFQQPRVFRTICTGDEDIQDDFADLAGLVSSLAQRKIIEQLHNRGWLNRLLEQRAQVKSLALSLGSKAQGSALALWRERWSTFVEEAVDNQRLDVIAFARQFEPGAEEAVFKRLLASGADVSAQAVILADSSQVEGLWNQWARKRLQSMLDRFTSDFAVHGLVAKPLGEVLGDIPAQAEQRITDGLRQRLNATVRNPGPPWRRSLQQVCKQLQLILPMAAIGWAGWRVLNGFVGGADDPQAYVGFGVLSNALMLAGFGWLIAWLATQLLKPAVGDWIVHDLQAQLRKDLTAIGAEHESGIEKLVDQRLAIERQLEVFDSKTRRIFDSAHLLENQELTQLLLPHPSVE